jgi:CelD/BcsL family acetyltransferase involved in cellulose biosynthesis
MVVTELRAGDRPVSWEISFRYGGTHFAYITSHACDLTDLSPGRLHFDYVAARLPRRWPEGLRPDGAL